MRQIGPCLCGDPGCASCGTAQGYREDGTARCFYCGRFIEDRLNGFCPGNKCYSRWDEMQRGDSMHDIVTDIWAWLYHCNLGWKSEHEVTGVVASFVFSNSGATLKDLYQVLNKELADLAAELLELERVIWDENFKLSPRNSVMSGYCQHCGGDLDRKDHPCVDDHAFEDYCTKCALLFNKRLEYQNDAS